MSRDRSADVDKKFDLLVVTAQPVPALAQPAKAAAVETAVLSAF